MSDDSLNLDAYGVPIVDWYDVGPQSGGTYNVPAAAQPNNTPWDAAGGTTANYGNDVLKILSQGIGAWSQYQRNEQFLDYQRYEATAGGVYQQGRPVPGGYVGGQATVRASGNPMMLLLLGLGVVLLLRK